MRNNPEVDFIEMNEDSNLKNWVGIQMSQIEGVKIKKATKKGSDM